MRTLLLMTLMVAGCSPRQEHVAVRDRVEFFSTGPGRGHIVIDANSDLEIGYLVDSALVSDLRASGLPHLARGFDQLLRSTP